MRRGTIHSAGADEVCVVNAPILIFPVCSGQALAEQGTQITVARLLWGFNFNKCKDANGKPIDIDTFDYTNGLNWRPQPFDCVITPRSQQHVDVMKSEGDQALRDSEVYNGTTKYVP
jgi:hypothetical protein